MGYAVNGPIVRNGLAMNVDVGYDRCYSPRENLIDYSTYNAGTWAIPLGNATLTTGIDAPDGSLTAVRYSGSNTGDSIFRITHPSFTANGTTQYTISMWVRLISGSASSPLGISMGWGDVTPSVDYRTLMVANQWVRVTATATTAAGTYSFLDILDNNNNNYVIDFWGVQLERSGAVTTYTPTAGSTVTRGTTIADVVSGTTFSNVSNTAFRTENGGYLTFSGAGTSYIENTTHPSLNLTNNATLEAWVYVDSWRFSGIITYGTNAAEQYSLVIGSGNQFGLIYNWPGTGYNVYSSSQGTATGRWFHAVTTFSDGLARVYVNGVLNNSTVNALTAFPVVAGAYVAIGNQHPGTDEMLFGRVAIARIYNRELTPTEVAQNFAAHRGRFGV